MQKMFIILGSTASLVALVWHPYAMHSRVPRFARYPMGWTPPHPTPASVRHTGRWLENYQLESQEKPI